MRGTLSLTSVRLASVLGLSASVLALACSGGAAEAQTAQSQSTSGSNTIETVVVTAERRVTNIQRTNVAATVISGDDLTQKGVITVDQLQFIAPSVTVDNFGQGIDFDIRGIGKGEHNTQTTTGVITYRDGVQTFPGYFQEEPYFDISSVEILRGPQGTFAGQNSTGGAVFVNTNNPVIGGTYGGYVQANLGNYAEAGLQGAVNIPISDDQAGRIAFYSDERNSFWSITGPGGSKYNGNPGNVREGAVRFSYLWKPTESLSILFKTDADYLDFGAYPADPYYATNDIYHITANSPQLGIDQFVRSSLKVDYSFGGGYTLQSVSSYQYGNSSYKADLDGTALLNDTFIDSVDGSMWTQEFNVISPDKGPVTWIAGLYAQTIDYDFPPPYKFLIGTPPTSAAGLYLLQGTNVQANLAAFGQVSVDLGSGFQLQLGGRYTANSTKNDVNVIQYGLPIIDSQKGDFDGLTYKAALNWTVNDDNYVYGFVSKGFKPGGLNVPVGLGQPAPFTSEKVMDYEAGWKNTAFDGHLRTQLDGYYMDYDNFQVTVGYPTFPTFGFELNDPSTTKIYGVEGSSEASFGALAFTVGVGLMNSQLGTFYATDPRIAAFAPCNPDTGPASASCFNLEGHHQTYAPNFTFNLGAQYAFDLDGGDKLTPGVTFGHESQQWATLFDNPALGDRLGSRDILGASLAWTHGTWVTTLYGTNLTNEHYVEALNSNLRFAGAPLQFGVRLMKLF
ncbi:MAG TPA: TonB-dependent receptor [Rhizomicrobium sp.]|nr:TonB-dependent receptor [Rhizomicrobium sp.]